MHRKLHAVALVLVLAASLVGFNRGTPPAAPSPAESLLTLLPSSDFVAFCDLRQATGVVLPALLAQRPEWQAKVDRDFADFQRETGIDPHSFDSVAVGVRLNGKTTGAEPNFVMVARGGFDAAGSINAAFAAQAKNGRTARVKREIQYAGHTIYLAARPDGANGVPAKAPAVYGDHEIAALVIDANTIAFGDLASMRSVVDAANGKDRVDDELVALATRTQGALGGFAGTVPGNFSAQFLGGDQSDAIKALSGIKQVCGSVSSAGTDFDSRVTLRTENPDQAHSIGQMINAVKLLSKAGDTTGNNRRSAESLLHDVNVNVEGNEIDLTLRASFADLMGVATHF